MENLAPKTSSKIVPKCAHCDISSKVKMELPLQRELHVHFLEECHCGQHFGSLLGDKMGALFSMILLLGVLGIPTGAS